MNQTADAYHWRTAYERHKMTPHHIDWASQPLPFKAYPSIELVQLPEISRNDLPDMSLGSACDGTGADANAGIPDPMDLARIFAVACGLTAKARHPGGDIYFRSAPSAGALYPNEVYLAWPGSERLASGIYHYSAHRGGFTPLRDRHGYNALRPAFVPQPDQCSAVFVVSGIFFRSAWKYRERAYRYLLLDAGHLLENLRLSIAAAGFAGGLAFDFDDTAVNQWLCLDAAREVALGAIVLADGPSEADGAGASVDFPGTADLASASRVADQEVTYDAILDIHQAGHHIPADRVSGVGPEIKPHTWQPLGPGITAGASFTETALRRRSRRNFIDRSMTADQFTCLLNLICCTHAAETLPENNPGSVACGCLVGNVTETPSGFYMVDTVNRRLGQVFSGDLRKVMATICLDQAWLANAAVHVAFMADLAWVDKVWGARGYRYAMMTAGRIGHAVYLAATAMNLGCCGIGAFYDREAAQVLSLKDKTAMLYLLGLGPVKSGRHG
ncbi:MAG: SagB/ThcOx family dehydrogenase [Thermodesulfobacteriota bacterium]|nr:SagB/ThcOx family dehydrogenase [Thermodesulfobacteriota bacterium]